MKSVTVEGTFGHVWTAGRTSAAAVGQLLPLPGLADPGGSGHLWGT